MLLTQRLRGVRKDASLLHLVKLALSNPHSFLNSLGVIKLILTLKFSKAFALVKRIFILLGIHEMCH